MKPARYLDKPAKSKENWLKNWLVASPKILWPMDLKTGYI